ncbi:MAG: tyrosine-type recombinase/integrase [Lachnospiraceae bacterium]
MPLKGENIYKRKDGRWEGRYIRFYDENEKAKYGYVYAKTYVEVKQKLLEKKAAASRQPDNISGQRISYNEVLDAWLQSSRMNIKESTYARYVHLINTHIRPHLGNYQISKISTQRIERFLEQQLERGRLDNGRPLSPKTVTDILTIVKSTMEYAKYHNLNVICNLKKLTIKKREKEMRVLCQSEQNALIQVLMHEMDLYKFGVLLALYTGIRIGELCALQWEDLNMKTATLKIRKTMQRIQDTSVGAASKTKVIITEPKSQCSFREIPLPGFITDIANEFIDHPKAFILTGDKKKYVEPRTMQNRFKGYVCESGIRQANFHALRHTFATRCVEVGFELKSLSEVLGHANVNITLNRYVHSSFDLKHTNMNKLAFLA